ncbi:MAG TPA: beta-ketoacyl-[acyl-carrier-protein] synthase II [Dehalococcoidia bacterium]|nr:beta-ketoacyl-[acyl-carrier-protein] synthase II [Dehalococcoidia bacterium]
MRRRVVVTGVGVITPLGTGVEKSWTALCQGQSGISPITRFDATPLKCRIAGEVKDFHPLDFMDKKLARRFDPFIQYAVAAARMAVEDACLQVNIDNEDKVGVIMGTGVGAWTSFESACPFVVQGSLGKVPPFLILNATANSAAGIIAIEHRAKGPHHLVMEACASGTSAIGLGFRCIQRGEADAIIAGGAEAPITASLLASLDILGALTSKRNGEPEKASRPFDGGRDGFVPGEGSGVVVLEALETALRRGAKIYGEVLGYGNNCDAFHYTSPTPDGEGPAKCLELALRDAGIGPADVDYINAHGTSTIINDLAETRAIKKVFGEHAKRLAVSSNKSAIGHLWGAAGAVEAVFSLLTITHGIIPPTINQEFADPECDLDYVPNKSRQALVEIALSNSFGFGGVNGTLVFKKFQL